MPGVVGWRVPPALLRGHYCNAVASFVAKTSAFADGMGNANATSNANANATANVIASAKANAVALAGAVVGQGRASVPSVPPPPDGERSGSFICSRGMGMVEVEAGGLVKCGVSYGVGCGSREGRVEGGWTMRIAPALTCVIAATTVVTRVYCCGLCDQ